MPNIRSKESMYVTRQSQNYNIPKSRLNIYKSSFVPKAIDEWNAIPLEIRQSSTLASFKNSLNTLKPTRPLYFSYGERYWNIIHTRLRHKCANCENHKLLTTTICAKYAIQRNELFNSIFRMKNLCIVNTQRQF